MGVFRLDCPHCSTARVACEVVWQSDRRGEKLILMLCGSCRLPITAAVRNNYGALQDLIQLNGDLTNEQWFIRESWPEVTKAAAPAHTPWPVAKRYIEGEEAYKRKSWNAAVAMFRSSLDIATKTMADAPEGATFFKRLEWLHTNHRITPDMWAWADRVRIEGNEALHDPEDFTEEEAKPLRLFTETFLKYVFELPGEIATYRQDTEEA
ncbi:MAG: DUF4145 domain-containing protein [Candidatus Brevundimonas phytovorans]|nr:DUF4145 domain-containing protein [Brevundimonas sp.]WEK56473.1 MAG: DUF4145 domain-containing protein [Brevundimonas sp.]